MNGSQDSWQTMVDMGNFSSNLTDMVHIQVDYVTPIFMAVQDNPAYNCFDTVEILLDGVPQQYSYDNETQTNTYLLAFMERDTGAIQTRPYNTNFAVDLNNDPQEMLQMWKFTQAPSKIVVRPEVLQKKVWNIRLKFSSQDEPSTVTNNFKQSTGRYNTFFQSVGDYKIVMSCETK